MRKVIFLFLIISVLYIVYFQFVNNDKKINNLEFNIANTDRGLEPEEIPLYGNTSWAVTQWGSNDGKQMMFFTIEGNKGGFVIVDGGYEDSDFDINVMEAKLLEHNNVVDAWVVTHFDDDHCGQFLSVLKNHPEVEIRRIFVQNAPTDIELLLKNRDDDYDAYEEYLKLNKLNITKVHPGNIFYNIIGMKLEILSSYEDWIDEKCDNLLNNGSIVFKLYGNKESILFCGDVQSPIIGEYLIDNYKDKLHSDYLQIGHHGNNNLSYEFYDLVNPKVGFICLPDWILNAKISWHTAKDIIKYLEKNNCIIYSFNTSPNQVIMY